MCINWIDDCISAIISTLLAVGVSYYFYRKSNRDAVKNDILRPIAMLTMQENIAVEISKYKRMYIYRFLKTTEKEAIDKFYDAYVNAKKHSYEKSFENSLLEYFYKYCGVERYHFAYIAEINEKYEELNYNEKVLRLDEYSGYFNEDGLFDETARDELKKKLIQFYKDEIGGSQDLSRMFETESISDIFYNSEEYSRFIEAKENFKHSAEILVNLAN